LIYSRLPNAAHNSLHTIIEKCNAYTNIGLVVQFSAYTNYTYP